MPQAVIGSYVSQSVAALDNTQSMQKGIHILADFFDCQSGSKEMLESKPLEIFCKTQVANSGLAEVGSLFYQFEGAGVTGVILLAESHLSIHTWPEKDYLALDIFVCNITQDNSDKARSLYQAFVSLFEPSNTNYREIERE